MGLGKEVERVFGGKQEGKGVMDEEIAANWEFPRLRIEAEMGEIIKIVEKDIAKVPMPLFQIPRAPLTRRAGERDEDGVLVAREEV